MKRLQTKFVLLISLISICTPLFIYPDEQKSVYKKVLNQNIQSIEYEEDEFNTERYGDFVRWALDTQLNLNEHRKRRTAFLLLDKHAIKENLEENSILNDTVTWKDLTLFCGQKDVKLYFADKVDRTTTMLGRATLFGMLVQPTTDREILKKRQLIIKELIENEAFFDQTKSALQTFKNSENILLAFYCKQDSFKQIVARRYFSFGKPKINDMLNCQPMILNIRNVADHVQRATFFATTLAASVILPAYAIAQVAEYQMPDHMLKTAENLRGSTVPIFGIISEFLSHKLALGGIAALTGILNMLWIKDSHEWMTDNFLVDTFVQVKIMHIARALESMQDIDNLIHKNEVLNNSLDRCNAFNELQEKRKSNSKLKQLFNLLKTDTFNTKPSLLTNKGNVFLAYKLFTDTKEEFENAMLAIGELDAYLSIATLYKEHADKRVHYCFAQYEQGSTPSMHMKDFWNPFIDADKVVANSLELGSNQEKRNMIITGPNAGGKSTLLKAIALTIIMAQSFGIAPASELSCTPFSKIITYLNITDDIGAGNSLFKAQTQRAQYLMDTVHTIKNNELSFSIIDEMFNGTSPKEAQACAFSLAKSLGNIPHNIAIVATHFDMLTRLEAQTEDYTNYHVSVERLRSGGIAYPFKLERGISDQHVALDILKAEGFQGSIVQEAQDILDKSLEPLVQSDD